MSRSCPTSNDLLVSWAAERRHADAAYERWCRAQLGDKSLAYAAYLAAADREDAAAAAAMALGTC
jgi:hypothetical protein